MPNFKRTGFHEIEGTIECVSGVRVGGSQDDLEIGGIDLPVIKHPKTKKPYIPGSSLKGKMRGELEKQLGKFSGKDNNEPCGCARTDCAICRIFGPHKNTKSQLGPTRIIVRDSPIAENAGLEIKTENMIDRQTGVALHPRKLERVAAGSTFKMKISVQVLDMDSGFQYEGKSGEAALLAVVRKGLELVGRTGLGSSISRGSGQVAFKGLKLDGADWQ
jgi:CRISPR-associated protein Csm3